MSYLVSNTRARRLAILCRTPRASPLSTEHPPRFRAVILLETRWILLSWAGWICLEGRSLTAAPRTASQNSVLAKRKLARSEGSTSSAILVRISGRRSAMGSEQLGGNPASQATSGWGVSSIDMKWSFPQWIDKSKYKYICKKDVQEFKCGYYLNYWLLLVDLARPQVKSQPVLNLRNADEIFKTTTSPVLVSRALSKAAITPDECGFAKYIVNKKGSDKNCQNSDLASLPSHTRELPREL